jgi:hypothetical protein
VIVPELKNRIVSGKLIVTLLVGGDMGPLAVSTVNETELGIHSLPLKVKKSPPVAPERLRSPKQSKDAFSN